MNDSEIIDGLPAFVLVLDDSGKIVLWNARLEQASGFRREEMIGRDGRAIVSAPGDVRLELKGGGHRLVRWQLQDVASESGTRRVCALGTDVTQERDVLRRTLQSERLAAVGTLAAGLAHELRNPLNSASLQLTVLEGRIERGETEPASLETVFAIVRSEIARAENLLKDFLEFARPQPLRFESSDLNTLLESAVEAVRREIGRREIVIETELDPGVGKIQLDAGRTRQVVLNLLKNSIEALGADGRIVVRSRAADENGFVEVEIADNGPGFPTDAPIFDAFFTSKPAGTGLGLSIAHSVVRDHGGTLRASSGDGRTSFAFRLPQHSR